MMEYNKTTKVLSKSGETILITQVNLEAQKASLEAQLVTVQAELDFIASEEAK